MRAEKEGGLYQGNITGVSGQGNLPLEACLRPSQPLNIFPIKETRDVFTQSSEDLIAAKVMGSPFLPKSNEMITYILILILLTLSSLQLGGSFFHLLCVMETEGILLTREDIMH